MPMKGKCQSCGNYALLFGTVVKKKDGSGLRYIMCCLKCKEFFKNGGKF